MKSSPDDRGIVLVCDRHGTVKRIVRDDLGLTARVGSNLHEVVDRGVREKLDGFLSEVQARAAAYDWEITVQVDGALQPLHFSGAQMEPGYLVVATCSRQGVGHINDDLMRINNEQTNFLRTTNKELARVVGQRAQRDDSVYVELTRLNNDMMNLQRELAKKNAELEQLNQQKNRLVGMAAHDLRNPLGVISAYAEFLETEAAPVLNEEHREFVTTIKETSEFMLGLVTDLLTVTAIEAGQLILDRQPADLALTIQRNVALNRVLAAKKDIAVEFDPPALLPELTFDVGKIEQVLNNLIGNAVKYSHRGTRVRVTLQLDGDSATVEVADQGQGIPREDLPKLFQPFARANVRATGGEQSTGLGLAIVRKIIEGHGGRIWVESEVGRGSTFFFTLPIHRD